MGPENPLPLSLDFADPEAYVDSLLSFGTTSQILHTLCGGVHILDFLTRSPDLYSTVLPVSWRDWFSGVDVSDVLDLLMREDLAQFGKPGQVDHTWRGHPQPPKSLVVYIADVRRHLLVREYGSTPQQPSRAQPSRQLFLGMNPKKVHEVDNFAKYVDDLASKIEEAAGNSITHLADFGAGQNYLGRVLASAPYNRDIVAIESRSHVVEGAKSLDMHAKVTEKPVILRNKKQFRAERAGTARINYALEARSSSIDDQDEHSTDYTRNGKAAGHLLNRVDMASSVQKQAHMLPLHGPETAIERPKSGRGTIQYIEHRIKDGDLSSVIEHIMPSANACVEDQSKLTPDLVGGKELLQEGVVNSDCNDASDETSSQQDTSLMVISLHSCGNLVHHGLRTLTLNSAVKAVALIGCCYNLMTERLEPPTHKLHLRPDHPRLIATGNARDPNGFPMSDRFVRYRHRANPPSDFTFDHTSSQEQAIEDVLSTLGSMHERSLNADREEQERDEEGIRLNITARMMAVQAPQNWTEAESSSFFTRHYFRAVLQRIFLDKGVVSAPPTQHENQSCSPAGSSWGLANGDGSGTAPVVIGNLKKKCYESFTAYVRGAVDKLSAAGGEIARVVKDKVGRLSDDEIREYELQYQGRKKELSIVWSLMAFSAGVVEAMIIVDRWLWLKEQPCVKQAWVQPVFSYALSPRNLVVVGVK